MATSYAGVKVRPGTFSKTGNQTAAVLTSDNPDIDQSTVVVVAAVNSDDTLGSVASDETLRATNTALAALASNASVLATNALLGKGAKTLTTPSMNASTATLLLAANAARREAIITNPSLTQTLYIGPAGVTNAAYTYAIPALGGFIDDTTNDAWYGLTDVGSLSPGVTEIA